MQQPFECLLPGGIRLSNAETMFSSALAGTDLRRKRPILVLVPDLTVREGRQEEEEGGGRNKQNNGDYGK